jgi:putative FmdB family regulatory protein
MPMYEYRCSSCGCVNERYAAGASANEGGGVCPACGKGQLKKIFSTFSANCCGSGGGGTAPKADGCGGGSGHFS